mgnify:CR=1 FL=1
MENASKALLMAGGVLLALLIIGVGVYMSNTMNAVQKEQEESKQVEIITEFNKKFEMYNRKILYGSDILSLANMIDDYNERETVESKMYTEMIINVTTKKDIISTTKDKFSITKGTYKAQELREKLVAKDKESVDKAINEIESIYSKNGRMSIQNLYNLKLQSNSYEQDMGTYNDRFKKEIQKDIYRKLNVNEDIATYVDLTAVLKDFKTKIFSCTNVKYDQQNGRMIEMNFTEAI